MSGLAKPLTQNKLARLLRVYDVRPEGTRTARGYRRASLEDAWGCYLPSGEPPLGTNPNKEKEQAEEAPEGSTQEAGTPPSVHNPGLQPSHRHEPHGQWDVGPNATVTDGEGVTVGKSRAAAPGPGCDGVTVGTPGYGRKASDGGPGDQHETFPVGVRGDTVLEDHCRRLLADGAARRDEAGTFIVNKKEAVELHRAIEERRGAAALAGVTVSDNGARS